MVYLNDIFFGLYKYIADSDGYDTSDEEAKTSLRNTTLFTLVFLELLEVTVVIILLGGIWFDRSVSVVFGILLVFTLFFSNWWVFVRGGKFVAEYPNYFMESSRENLTRAKKRTKAALVFVFLQFWSAVIFAVAF